MSEILLVAVLAFVLGVAIQRGTTCAVLAVEELMRDRRADRFLGFFECGLWAAVALRLLGGADGGSAWSGWGMLLVGTALFGVGAAINGACAFGTVARLGNGRFEYLLTAIGAFAAIRMMMATGWAGMPSTAPPHGNDTTFSTIFILLTAVMILRWSRRRRMLRSFAILGMLMAVIGATGAVLGQLHQPWPWMSALGALPDVEPVVVAGLVSMIAGAVASGLIEGRFQLSRPSLAGIVRRLGGGALMGAGVSLVPGGNDALILQGIPNGDVHAILGYLVMLAAIALTLTVTQGISPPWRKSSL